jgi:L,D-transpeptidase ErfK/SrfK
LPTLSAAVPAGARLRPGTRVLRCLSVAAAAVSLGACSVIDGILAPPIPESATLPDRTLAEPQPPIDARRFALPEGAEVVGQLQVVHAREEDTFVDIARSYGLGYDELLAANPGVDPWLPGEGTRVILPTRFVLPAAPREGVVLNIAAKRLFYYLPTAEGETPVVETFPIGIGREGWATPTGETTVVSKARDPVWFVPASVRAEHAAEGDPLPAQVPPGPDNPLGNRVLGLGIPGYLIHGTNKPAGVGMRVSHGCVRLFPEDIEHLYERVPIGTPVRIVNQPYLFGWQDDELLLEAHAPLEEDDRDWVNGLPGLARAQLVDVAEPAPAIDLERLADAAERQLGVPMPVLINRPSADAVLKAAQPVENVVRYEWLADNAPDE